MLLGFILALFLVGWAKLRVIAHLNILFIFTLAAACLVIFIVVIRLIAIDFFGLGFFGPGSIFADPLPLGSSATTSSGLSFLATLRLAGRRSLASLLTS